MTDPRPERLLDPIFSPRSIAVVGASRRRDSIGYSLVHNLVLAEFRGAIFPVNPSAKVIHSLKCYPDVTSVPDPIDLGIVMVPRDAVAGVVEELLAAGARGLIVITAGFAETGTEGAALEHAIADTVRRAGVRMVGPNCMGAINADPEVSMNATFAPTPAAHGSIGFVSQSGALGVAILNAAADLGIGFTQFVSIGNKADVSGNDLLQHWEDDEATRVICMYLESFGNPRNFTALAKRVSKKKPILIVKSGRTAAGARAASSHTGAIAGADITVSAFLSQCGVLRAATIEELFAVARALDRCPLPAGKRVAVLTNAGGPAIMATDALVNLDLDLAELAPATVATLASFLPPEASLANPIDMIASAGPREYGRSLATLLADDGVDMLLVINVTPLLANPIDILDAVSAVTAAGTDKPVLAVMMATDDFHDEAQRRPGTPPVYRFPENAARALAQLYRYAAWRRRPEEPAPRFATDDEAVAAILAAAPGRYLSTADAFRILELYGIPVAPWRRADAADDLGGAAAELGFPLALKAEVPGVVHKSDVGAVALDLDSAPALERARREMETALAAAGHTIDGYIVQSMLASGHEVIFGITLDPRFGPLVMFGLGGRYVEVFEDVAFGVTPLAVAEAREMVAGIRGARLLAGVRGEPAADRELLIEVLLRVAQLAERHPSIVELDINPFLAAPDRAGARAVDARVRVAATDATS